MVGFARFIASLKENLKLYLKQFEINCYLQRLFIYLRYNALNI
jgi:hypothetical protein